MTPRLPIVGSDKDVWGDILLEWLRVHGNEDGSLKGDAARLGINTPIYTETLSVDTDPWTISGLDLTAYTKVKMILIAQVTGTTTFGYAHTFCRFNGDSTVDHYAGSVKNTDGSTNSVDVISALGQSFPATQNTNSILIGHAPSPANGGVNANIWGSHEMVFVEPGRSGTCKNLTVENLLMTSFTSYGGINPIKMHGCGFWIGTNPITSITFTNEFTPVSKFKIGSKFMIFPVV